MPKPKHKPAAQEPSRSVPTATRALPLDQQQMAAQVSGQPQQQAQTASAPAPAPYIPGITPDAQQAPQGFGDAFKSALPGGLAGFAGGLIGGPLAGLAMAVHGVGYEMGRRQRKEADAAETLRRAEITNRSIAAMRAAGMDAPAFVDAKGKPITDPAVLAALGGQGVGQNQTPSQMQSAPQAAPPSGGAPQATPASFAMPGAATAPPGAGTIPLPQGTAPMAPYMMPTAGQQRSVYGMTPGAGQSVTEVLPMPSYGANPRITTTGPAPISALDAAKYNLDVDKATLDAYKTAHDMAISAQQLEVSRGQLGVSHGQLGVARGNLAVAQERVGFERAQEARAAELYGTVSKIIKGVENGEVSPEAGTQALGGTPFKMPDGSAAYISNIQMTDKGVSVDIEPVTVDVDEKKALDFIRAATTSGGLTYSQAITTAAAQGLQISDEALDRVFAPPYRVALANARTELLNQGFDPLMVDGWAPYVAAARTQGFVPMSVMEDLATPPDTGDHPQVLAVFKAQGLNPSLVTPQQRALAYEQAFITTPARGAATESAARQGATMMGSAAPQGTSPVATGDEQRAAAGLPPLTPPSIAPTPPAADLSAAPLNMDATVSKQLTQLETIQKRVKEAREVARRIFAAIPQNYGGRAFVAAMRKGGTALGADIAVDVEEYKALRASLIAAVNRAVATSVGDQNTFELDNAVKSLPDIEGVFPNSGPEAERLFDRLDTTIEDNLGVVRKYGGKITQQTLAGESAPNTTPAADPALIERIEKLTREMFPQGGVSGPNP